MKQGWSIIFTGINDYCALSFFHKHWQSPVSVNCQLVNKVKYNSELCPFAKPILGKWCQCPHAKLADRCSGKMTCTRSDDLQVSCLQLDEAFKVNTRFILGVNHENTGLTHAHLMKIRCGGLLGMQRVLKLDSPQAVDVHVVIDSIIKNYASIKDFPYNEIVQDIKNFRHRK